MTHGARLQQMERQVQQMSQDHPHHAGMAEQRDMAVGRRDHIVGPVFIPAEPELFEHGVRSGRDHLEPVGELTVVETGYLPDPFERVPFPECGLMQILRRECGGEFRFPVRIRGQTLIPEFVCPGLDDDRKTEFFRRRLRGLPCPAHRRRMNFIQPAFDQPVGHQPGLFPAFFGERVGNIIRFAVTDQIQQHDV